jgi:hypothetical protein
VRPWLAQLVAYQGALHPLVAQGGQARVSNIAHQANRIELIRFRMWHIAKFGCAAKFGRDWLNSDMVRVAGITATLHLIDRAF